MRKSILILIVLLSSLILNGCAHSPGVRILEERANYDKPEEKKKRKVPKGRIGSQVVKAWLHAHEMPTGDQFDGAWLRLLVRKERWKTN